MRPGLVERHNKLLIRARDRIVTGARTKIRKVNSMKLYTEEVKRETIECTGYEADPGYAWVKIELKEKVNV